MSWELVRVAVGWQQGEQTPLPPGQWVLRLTPLMTLVAGNTPPGQQELRRPLLMVRRVTHLRLLPSPLKHCQ